MTPFFKPVLAFLAALLVGALAMVAVHAKQSIQPVFVPFSINYVNGALVNVTAMKDDDTDKFYVFADLSECREKLQSATEHALMSAPPGHGVVGMCIPVASLDPTIRKPL